MAIFTVETACSKCKKLFERLWPLGGGVCDECLTAHYNIEEAKKSTCGCLHSELEKLYSRK